MLLRQGNCDNIDDPQICSAQLDIDPPFDHLFLCVTDRAVRRQAAHVTQVQVWVEVSKTHRFSAAGTRCKDSERLNGTFFTLEHVCVQHSSVQLQTKR